MPSALSAPASPGLCPLCGGEPRLLHPGRLAESDPQAPPEPYTIARMSYGTPFPVTRCESCGLGQARVPWDRPEVLEVYRRGEDPTYPKEEAARRLSFRRGLEAVRQELRRARPDLARPRLLDVGAATGFLLAEARELGFDALGLEPSAWAAAEARRRFGVEVVEAGLESAGLPAASFDAVTLVDVIEHFSEPFLALAEVGRILRPGGLVYVVTPDLASFAARRLGPRWWGFEPWHLWYFDRPSLTRTLVSQGFEPCLTGSYARTFSLGYWLEKCRGLSRPIFGPLAWLARATGLAALPITIDLHDTLEILAVRRSA